jgi:hypothetical protein
LRETLQQVALAVYGRDRRHANVQHQKRHREREYPIAQSREPLERAAGNAVVVVLERRLGGACQLTGTRLKPSRSRW